MAIDDTAVNRFIKIARLKDQVTIDDLRNAFPIETMTSEDVAKILSVLEEASISVEIDPALLAPRHGGVSEKWKLQSKGKEGRAVSQHTELRSSSTNTTIAMSGSISKGTEARRSKKNRGDMTTNGPFSHRAILWLAVLVVGMAILTFIWLMRT